MLDRAILRLLSHPAGPWLVGALIGLAAALLAILGGPPASTEVRP